MVDYDLILFDRVNAIKDIVLQVGLDKCYLSFSGGKDSTVLHYLLDMALPHNSIPRVFINTGIEYVDIVKFVQDLAGKDDRFVLIKPSLPIKRVLETYGYPFKSKEHSSRVYDFNHGYLGRALARYLNDRGSRFCCPKSLLYQFSEAGFYNFSHLCCRKLKKEPAHKFAVAHGLTCVLTGMRNSEGGQRAHLGCVVKDKDNKVVKFHPLMKVDDGFEDWFIERFSIGLCRLYYPPFNFRRTGCKGCPFNLLLQEQLTTMAMYLPNERKQCELIWKYVYDEYRRIGYRLDPSEQLRLF